MAGDQLTLADLMFCFSVDLACAVGKKVLNIDFLEDFPQAKTLLQQLRDNPHMARIAEDKDAAMPAFMEMIRSGKR
ncbi:Glutathione S-transferase [compost metagenome]